MHSEDGYTVSLETAEGRKEILPYLHTVIASAREGMLTGPGGNLISDRDISQFNQPTHEGPQFLQDRGVSITPQNVEAVLSHYIFDFQNDHAGKKAAEVVNFVLFEKPGTVEGSLEHFMASHDAHTQQLMKGLLVYEERNMKQRELEKRVAKEVTIRVLGTLAAGKTTFLHTVARGLALAKVNREVVSAEPEDIEDFYPEVEVMNHYEYQRDDTRGKEATLGQESLKVYSYMPTTNEIVKAFVHSSGGHFRADTPYDYLSFDASAFFIDYTLMQELARLNMSVAEPQWTLGNNETLLEVTRSLLVRLNEWYAITGPKIGIITKLPSGVDISPDTFDVLRVAYANLFHFADEFADELQDKFLERDADFSHPDLDSFESSSDLWMPIYSDSPTYTGSLDVLHKLVQLATKTESPEETQLVTFNEKETLPNTVLYEEI